jgi:hypothetical protein
MFSGITFLTAAGNETVAGVLSGITYNGGRYTVLKILREVWFEM